MKKKIKPKPIHWLLSLYWWNPFIYLFILASLFYYIGKTIVEWFVELWELITEYSWV